MTKYLAGVLTVIGVGVLLIAYGLLNPRVEVDGSSAGYVASPGSAAFPAVTGQMPMSEPTALRSPAGYGYALVPAGGYVYPQSAYVQPTYAPAVYSSPTYAQPVATTAPEPRPVRTVLYEPPAVSRRATAPRVERAPQRNWKRTALIIGGASAAGAGVGALVGGGKGALIGAAIGGGASTIYQTVK